MIVKNNLVWCMNIQSVNKVALMVVLIVKLPIPLKSHVIVCCTI